MRGMKSKLVARFALAISVALAGLSAAQADDLPMPARSWGGIVRATPQQKSQKLASLREGETVTIIARTNAEQNGYPFFKIRYRDNRSGFQWGGVLCPVGTALHGTYQVCPASGPMPK